MIRENTLTDSAQSGVEIQLRGVTKRFRGQSKPAIADLDLTIPAGELVIFVGPSGCGKTTTLKMINRLIEPSGGSILIDGDDVTHTDPTKLRRQIGYVIQGGGMIPHMTVAGNIGLVPGLLKWDKSRIRQRVDELLDMVGLAPETYRDRYPRELSGGEQQRVGVARGLAADPPVVLMDEPFGAVDPITRSRLQDELMSIQSELGKTIVCVTHDIDEAIKLGDRILILEPGGKIAQYDTPQNILAAPANDFVKDFIGSGSTLKQLSLCRADDLPFTHLQTATIGEPTFDVVRRLEEAGETSAVIVDEHDRPCEWLGIRQLQNLQEVPAPARHASNVIDRSVTVNNAVDSMLASSHGGVMVTEDGVFIGVLMYDAVIDYVRALNEEAVAWQEDTR
ncbi:ABC transporter ATP-binding protein [Corynebacterium sputi]|uniref:ABC transporter ATP-binding protein n=1 Tax=Corynebacterium sputi TaxID=489915 RepID=UPI00040DF9D5|nr:ATP-binding cassette domain-containing protein [Corynebacterium sputi]